MLNIVNHPLWFLRLAFGDGEYLPPETITEADTAAAGEALFIVPVIGAGVFAETFGGSACRFSTEYPRPRRLSSSVAA